MEEDLDKFVELCASLLTSDEGIRRGCHLLMGLCDIDDKDREPFARVAQEIAACNGGAVLRRLLWLTLGQSYRIELDTQGHQHFRASSYTLSLGMLSSSKVVVERCLKEGLQPEGETNGAGPESVLGRGAKESGTERGEESGTGREEESGTGRGVKESGTGTEVKVKETRRVSQEKENARQIYGRLIVHVAHFSRIMRLSGDLPNRAVLRDLGTLVVCASLETLANFARASKAFRDAIRDLSEQRNIFVQFGGLLHPEYLAQVSHATAPKIRLALASLAVSLACFPDSQTWAVDRGLLKLIEAIYVASPPRELSKQAKRVMSPAYRCNVALFRLLSVDALAEKLRAHNALEGFRPHKRTMNSADLISHPSAWAYFEGRLQGRRLPLRGDLSAADWKLAEEQLSGTYLAPVVCSWKLCAAGREPVVGKGFSKCGSCQVARYCSKEHQTLHWETHKKHCGSNAAKKHEKGTDQ